MSVTMETPEFKYFNFVCSLALTEIYGNVVTIIDVNHVILQILGKPESFTLH